MEPQAKYYFTIQTTGSIGSNRRTLLNSTMYVGSLDYLTKAIEGGGVFHHHYYNYHLKRMQIDVVPFVDMKIVHEDEVLKDTGHTPDCWQHTHAATNWIRSFPNFCRTCWAKGAFEFPATYEDPGDYAFCEDCIGAEHPKCPRCATPCTEEFKQYVDEGGDTGEFRCAKCSFGVGDWSGLIELDQCECWDMLYEQSKQYEYSESPSLDDFEGDRPTEEWIDEFGF